MGDRWPWGPPAYVTWKQAFRQLQIAGMGDGNANIGAAIGEAESGFDYMVLNDTPSTGDYSVGIWQINYYGSLYASRTGQFGTPKELALSGVVGQANACMGVFSSSGWGAWTTYTSGAYRKYLNNAYPVGGGSIRTLEQLPDPSIKPPTGDYSGTVHSGATQFDQAGNRLGDVARVLARLRR